MKLKLNTQFEDLSGKPEEGENSHIGKCLAMLLNNSNLGDSLKFRHWAVKLYNAPHEIELDMTDKDILVAWLKTIRSEKSNIQPPNAIIGQLEEIIKTQWEKQKIK